MLDRPLVVVGDEDRGGRAAGLERQAGGGDRVGVVVDLARRRPEPLGSEPAGAREAVAAGVDIADQDLARTGRDGEDGGAPFDAAVVAGFGQDALPLRAQRRDMQARRLIDRPGDPLVRQVHRPFAGHVEIGGDLVRGAVERLRTKAEIGHRTRQQVEIVRQQRRRERQRQLHRPGVEHGGGGGRGDVSETCSAACGRNSGPPIRR